MAKARIFAVGMLLAIALVIASLFLFGWSMFGQSMRSFHSEDGYVAPNPDEIAVLAQALESYGRSREGLTLCTGPGTVSKRGAEYLFERLVIQKNRFVRSSTGSAEDVTELMKYLDLSQYKRVALRPALEAMEVRGANVIIPSPWQTGQCDGWFDVAGPLESDGRMYVTIRRAGGEPSFTRCLRDHSIFEKTSRAVIA